MTRTDLVISLVKAGISGDADAVRTTAEAIAADERAKKHSGVADRIARAIEQTSRRQSSNTQRRAGLRTHDGSGGIQLSEPKRSLASLYLNKEVKRACEELIEEQRRSDLLRAHNMEPRHRLLLAGPPGNGKTTLAEAIAYEMALPLFTVRYESVVTSYLGETAQRLKRLFDFVRTEPCVLFFDEFDAIGKERGDIHETGEIKRVVTTLLLQLDDLPSYCILVGATNHPELLDKAAWRRFEIRLNLPNPSKHEMIDFFQKKLNDFDGKPGYTAKRLYEAARPENYAEAEQFFIDINRRLILSQNMRDLRSILDDRVKSFSVRRYKHAVTDPHEQPSNPPPPQRDLFKTETP